MVASNLITTVSRYSRQIIAQNYKFQKFGTPMSGKGKGAPKSAKGTAKRHRKTSSTGSKISGPAIRRLARRAGVPRVGCGCFPEVNSAIVCYLTDLLDCCRIYCSHSKRKTINCQDVIYSLRKVGGQRYVGF